MSTALKFVKMLPSSSNWILIIQPTKCINFSYLFLEQNSTCFGRFLCPSSGVFHCTHSKDICHTGLLTAFEQDQDGTSWLGMLTVCEQDQDGKSWLGMMTVCDQDQDGTSRSCSQTVSTPVWHIPLLCVQWKTPDDGHRNRPKHVQFYSKNKFEKLMHLVAFIIRIRVERNTATAKAWQTSHACVWIERHPVEWLRQIRPVRLHCLLHAINTDPVHLFACNRQCTLIWLMHEMDNFKISTN